MERFTISKSEKQTIYEIYRACRLCGAGGGYRMPIIQNIVDLESSDVELRQKIQECLQLEVRQDDRMPPLICELCVDKLNDFYEFFNLTRQTNVRTRTRLGLPLEMAKKGESETNDCILGVTEPVYVKDDEPSKKGKAGPKCSKKIKKEPEPVSVKIENSSESSSRSSSVSSRSGRARASPVRAGARAEPARAGARAEPARAGARAEPPRGRARAPAPAPSPAPAAAPAPRSRKSENRPAEPKPAQVTKEKKERKGELQNLLEDNMKFDDNALLVPRVMKRTREEPPRPALLPKRAKPAPKELVKEPTPPPPSSKPGPKSRKKPEPKAEPPKAPEAEKKIPVPLKVPKSKAKLPETPVKVKETPKPEPPTPKMIKCTVCGVELKTVQGLSNHLKSHAPSFTKISHACNPCEMWFVSAEESAAHHRYHRAATFPYHCRRCFEDYPSLQLYNDHIAAGQCAQWDEQPDVKCERCWASFPTQPLRAAHKCPGTDGRPGGKCSKCLRTYATVKTLKKHECKQKRKRDLIADPDVLRRLKPMQVRILRCDDLLQAEDDHYDVSMVKPNYGLAKNYLYPYLKLSTVKAEPLHRDSMVAIPLALKEELATDYRHWDSDDSDSEIVIRDVPPLSTLAIKKLFSKDCLGKVPRKKKRVKNEAFDNENDFGNVSSDINDIISSLGDDSGNCDLGSKDLTARIKDIIGCFDDSDVADANVASNHNDDKMVNESSRVELCNDETNDLGDNNESTNKEAIESNKVNDNSEEASSVEASSGIEVSDKVLENNSALHENEENDTLNRSQSQSEDTSTIHDGNMEVDVSLKKSSVDDIEMAEESREPENVSINGVSHTENENSFEDATKINKDEEGESKTNVHCNDIENESVVQDCSEDKKNDETSKPIKESPIKHSIENLIGESDKRTDKYINEVISSIEDIINKNPRNEEISNFHEQANGDTTFNEINNSNVMDVIEENIGENKEKRLSDNDKITLEDLLPKEDRPMDLENISDDDFNFDA